MTITVGITHHTEYQYDRPVSMSPHTFRLRPAPHSRTPISSYSLKIEPKEHFINWQQDPFGNYLARVTFPKKTTKFSFTVDVTAKLTAINPFDFFLEEYAEKFPFVYPEQLKHDLLPYLAKEDEGDAFNQLFDSIDTSKPTSTVDFLVACNSKVNQLVNYCIRLEPGVQTCEETLTKKSGSCRDSAWLLVQLFRHLGLAARFVSGYLVQLSSDEKSLDGPSGPESDFTDLHAWCEVYIPGAGWIGLDPTSGLFASEGHIPLACTPEPASAAPVTGGIDKCESTLKYHNNVTRLHEMPRSTKPFKEGYWHDINALGEKVDAQLQAMDVRLTMGGEPTFISIDDYESDQWNTAADGKEKRLLAHKLHLKMQNHFAQGGLRHYGQGKWYPGEPLPRWAYSCYWRTDGVPVWKNDKYQANIHEDYGFTHKQAETFGRALTKHLGLPAACLHPVYEDVLFHLWQEGCLADEPSPDSPELLTATSRKNFLATLEAGLDKPAGFVLPLSKETSYQNWQSCQWKMRRNACYLLPGDSPIGYRLPFNSISGEQEHLPEADPFSLPHTYDAEVNPYGPQRGEISSLVIKTALCVQAREGKLFVFMPPCRYSEIYFSLLHAIEAVAEQLDMPVIIEGYTPPTDARLKKFSVTPDPGVIEVNVQPTSTWSELVSNTVDLYQLAKETRLDTQKFLVDGRQTGTGGGNHVTMGGPFVSDSPFLRRPDLLRSFITYWQHHPGLSYLFSGLFIGPTSQAPRVDEARNESLYELEIAFSQMPAGEVPQPWLVDRLLRNLLTDLTGNTHRAEFCIDKLYSPDSPTGRLGIVEFRGFEMPPHAQMSLVQMLLLRTLLVRFWREPYHKPLVRWGTKLHDKFLLPDFVWQDVVSVCKDLNDSGFEFKSEWLRAFYEFRFPICGEYEVDGIHLQLRTAIEPWHVLGEEGTSQGTARYVDSSLERVQLKVTGLDEARYVVCCNQRRLPLTKNQQGEWVAGIRYRAWQPASALHPTIGVHAPLVFDVFDTWNGRSIGGFTYHVAHPGGRSFEKPPVNGLEAEGRRLARFWDHGHNPPIINEAQGLQHHMTLVRGIESHRGHAEYHVPEAEFINSEYPTTLDLRRPPMKS